MFRIFALVFVGFSLFTAPVDAEDFSQRQQAIFKTAAAVDGYLTEKLHAEFWGAVKASPDYYPGMEQDISATIGPMILDGLDFQREAWASVERSYAARAVVKTDGFVSARKKIENNPNPAVRAASIPRLQNADTILQAAAERTSYSSGDTNVFITPELIQQVKTGIDASFFRIQLLANPTWSGKPQEWQLKEAGLRVMSLLPFVYEQQDLAADNGAAAKVASYSVNLDGQNFLTLASIKGAVKVDSDAGLAQIARGTLTGAGISAPSVVSMKFRGEASAVATGQTQTSDGPIYGSVRAVRPSAREDVIVLFSISGTSQVDADSNRQGLELSTMID
ncbi:MULTISPECIES: hypothetical protein [unclassified Rhizobium]|jgi:hypothetical protein|uniref:hypothetical protein n=1 Tax=unclassified Rhizobium TaxID=2613769 RepID=UPI00026EFEEE|nr:MULTISPECIES: hypothetical protein [unclassified Rhizobium]EJJ28666.1 hypothetical protein PMI11_03047 [Rhizobium sp. CF142]MDR6669763.1 hypothetical protein [Rhizobium sp. 1399]